MEFSTHSIDTGIKSSDINVGGASNTTVTVWAYAESFDNGGVYEFGNTGIISQDFCLRTLSSGVGTVLKEGAFLDAGFADVTDNPITGTGITEQGSNDTERVLIVFTMCEVRPVVTNTATSWGGVSMTLLIANDEILGGGGRDGNLRAWILDEAEIQSASGNTLSTTWSGSTDARREAVGQFFINVDQTTSTANTKVAETQVPLVTYTNTNLSDTADMHVICNQGNDALSFASSSLTALVNGDLDTIVLNSQACAIAVGSSDGADQVMTITADAAANRNGGVSFSLLASSISADGWRMNHWGASDYDFTINGSLNTWTFFATTYDGVTSETFAAVLDTDDVVTSRGSIAVTLNIQDNVPLKIGSFSDDNQSDPSITPFNGRIADLRIYDRVLTDNEIQTLFMSKGKDGIIRNLQARYELRNLNIGQDSDNYFKGSMVATNAVLSYNDWDDGSTHTPGTPTGSLRCLIAYSCHNDSTNGITTTLVTYGGQSMTKLVEVEASETTNNYVSMWYLLEAGVELSSGSAIVATFSGTADRQILMHGFYQNVESVGNSQTGTELTLTTITLTSITADANSFIVGACGCGTSSGTYSTGNGFGIQIESSNSSHECAVIDQFSMGVALAPTWTYSVTPIRFAAVAGELQGDINGVTVEVPDIVEEDNLMVLFICSFGNDTGIAPNVTTPAGWILVTNGDLDATISTPSMWIYRRVASDSEPSSYTISGDQSCVYSAIMSIYTSSDVTGSVSSIATGTGTVMTCDSVSIGAMSVVLRFYCADDGENEMIGSDDGVYIRENFTQESNDGTFGNGGSMMLCDQLMQITPTNTQTGFIDGTEQFGCFTISFELTTSALTVRDHSANKFNTCSSGPNGPTRIADSLR